MDLIYFWKIYKNIYLARLTKTKVMVSNKRYLKYIQFVYNREEVEIISEYKYVDLGTISSSNTLDIFNSLWVSSIWVLRTYL